MEKPGESKVNFESVSQTHTIRVGTGVNDFNVRTARLPRLSTIPIDYDPRDHREPRNEIQPWMAYFNLLRTMLGPGLLGMPTGFSASGVFGGAAFTILVGIIVIHTHHLLLYSLIEVSKQLRIPIISYRYGFRLALLRGPPIFHAIGRRGPRIVAAFMCMSQLAICTVCVILTADSLRDIADFQSIVPSLLILLPCYLLMEYFMKNLRRITYISLFGSLLNTIGLILLFYHIFKEPIGETFVFETDCTAWFFTTGLAMFNLSSVPVVLTLDKALKRPKIMTTPYGVVNVGLGTATIVATMIGSLGYWSFGNMEENALRSLPFGDMTAMIVIAVYSISVALSFPLQSHSGVAVLLEVIKYRNENAIPTEETLKLIEKILRPTFVVLSFTIAYNVPFQGPFVAFVGTLCTTVSCVMLPVLMDISLRYGVRNGFGPYNYHLIKNVIILILAIITLIFGVYHCAYIIYVRMLSKYSVNAAEFF